jgi:hypothetical protein
MAILKLQIGRIHPLNSIDSFVETLTKILNEKGHQLVYNITSELNDDLDVLARKIQLHDFAHNVPSITAIYANYTTSNNVLFSEHNLEQLKKFHEVTSEVIVQNDIIYTPEFMVINLIVDIDKRVRIEKVL